MNITLKSCLFLILTCLATTFSIAINSTNAQEHGGWDKKIVGAWKIDIAETKKLWSKTWLKGEDADEMSIHMMVPQSVTFSDDGTISFRQIPATAKFKISRFDESTKRLVIAISGQFGESELNFTAIDNVRLTLHVAASVLGPSNFALKKEPDRSSDRFGKQFGQLKGKWKLDAELTKAWWKRSIPEKELAVYSKHATPFLKELVNIRFDNSRLLFEGDQSTELLELSSEVQTKNTMRFHIPVDWQRRRIDVTWLGKDSIKLVDGRRRFVGVYIRTKKDAAPPSARVLFDGVQQSPLEKSVVEIYVHKRRPPLSDRVKPIGINGNVEIEEIYIERRRAAGAVVSADITNMAIDLFVDTKTHDQSSLGGFLIKLIRLDSVVDDKRRLLSTKSRISDIEMLKRPIQARSFISKRDGRNGPSFSMRFDAPTVGATKLQRLAGEIEITAYSTRCIEIKDLRAHVGRAIKHPLLKDLTITPTIDDGQFPSIVLKLSGNRDRILQWWVLKQNDEELPNSSFGEAFEDVSHGFSQKIPKKISLWLKVAKDDAVTREKFEFRNIIFP